MNALAANAEPIHAVVFCPFPEPLASQIRKNLEEWGIHILHFGSISASTDMKDPGANSVICFFEMMSHGQSDQARRLAHRWHARYIPLSRKMASWTRFLPGPRQPLTVVQQDDSVVELSRPVENRFAYVPAEPSSDRVSSPGDQQWDELRELFASEVEDLKKANTEKDEEIARLKKAIESSHEGVLNLALDEERHYKARIEGLERFNQQQAAELSEAHRAIERLEATSLARIGAAFKTLMEAGLLTKEEMGQKLVHLVLR